jgi:hypothetical protein
VRPQKKTRRLIKDGVASYQNTDIITMRETRSGTDTQAD